MRQATVDGLRGITTSQSRDSAPESSTIRSFDDTNCLSWVSREGKDPAEEVRKSSSVDDGDDDDDGSGCKREHLMVFNLSTRQIWKEVSCSGSVRKEGQGNGGIRVCWTTVSPFTLPASTKVRHSLFMIIRSHHDHLKQWLITTGDPIYIGDYNKPKDVWTDDVPSSWYCVDLGASRSLLPTYYTLRCVTSTIDHNDDEIDSSTDTEVALAKIVWEIGYCKHRMTWSVGTFCWGTETRKFWIQIMRPIPGPLVQRRNLTATSESYRPDIIPQITTFCLYQVSRKGDVELTHQRDRILWWIVRTDGMAEQIDCR